MLQQFLVIRSILKQFFLELPVVEYCCYQTWKSSPPKHGKPTAIQTFLVFETCSRNPFEILICWLFHLTTTPSENHHCFDQILGLVHLDLLKNKFQQNKIKPMFFHPPFFSKPGNSPGFMPVFEAKMVQRRFWSWWHQLIFGCFQK